MQLNRDDHNLLKVALWSAVLIWAAWIFFLSAQTASESKSLSGQTIRIVAKMVIPEFEQLPQELQASIVSSWQHIARKTAHALLYFGLGILCMTALLQHSLEMKLRIAIALGISIGYAIADEMHQLFVDGRGAQFSDICIDAGGALMGVLLVVMVQGLWGRRSGNRGERERVYE